MTALERIDRMITDLKKFGTDRSGAPAVSAISLMAELGYLRADIIREAIRAVQENPGKDNQHADDLRA